MAVETYVIGRLEKRNKKGKVRHGYTIYRNGLGWVKGRDDKGVELWFNSIDELLTKIDRLLLLNYHWTQALELPEVIINRFQTNEDDELHTST